ncbi:MFS transporter [Pseudomonas aeruginosa]|nr:MFS transporter [Pseudomonas aeruginosa]MCT6020444.1 MFS transporter [Pseudomonas aeruginosa]
MAQREFSATSGGVLLASVVAIMLGPTGILLNTFSLFIAPMSAEYAWDRAEVSLLVTLFGLAVAITSPLKGWLIDRWGARRTMLGLTAALSLPLLGLAAVNAVWQLYALFLLIGLLAPGNLPYGRILGLWFRHRLGVAYGLLGLGFGVGGPLGLLVGHQSLEAWGWRGAFLVYGVLELGLALPLLAWLWRTELRQERRQAWPLLPPSLLRLPSIRFGLLLAILFFACWSGFMFALALALQAGAGLSPVQAGNAFIALGASYFVSALLTARVAARIGPVRLLLLGCVIQMCGLLGLMLTLQRVWPQPGILNLAPATLVIGFGQAFIVSSFFRIGLSEVPTAQAGAGSAMLATVQQASLGLGSALLGAVFAHRLERHGDYLEATQTTLAVEFVLMTLLLGATCLFYLRRVRTAPLRCDSPGN